MKRALVIGGSNGIGLALVHKLLNENYNKIYIVDRDKPDIEDIRIVFYRLNLVTEEYTLFDELQDIDTFIYTAGFGRVAPFEALTETEIVNNFRVNTLGFIRIIQKYYQKFLSAEPFYCAVMGSIAGYLSSPLFSIYGAIKAALVKFVESINVELSKKGTRNRILKFRQDQLKELVLMMVKMT